MCNFRSLKLLALPNSGHSSENCLECNVLQFGQNSHHSSVGFNRPFGYLVLGLGQSVTDGFALAFTGPKAVRSFLHPLTADFAAERSTDYCALADPVWLGQSGQKFLIAGG